MSNSRLYYIDNLRIFLIILVVLLHFNITYGAPGDWYYSESNASMPELIFQAMFNITNQSFFMGMFFFISAYFTAGSIRRKSSGKFLKDRLVRLGIPLIVFYFLLNPLTNWINYYFIKDESYTLIDFITSPRAWGFGPMWFVETLLIFTFLYMLIRKAKWKIKIPFPGIGAIIFSAFLVGLAQYIIRIWLPVGWSLPHTNLQFPFFIQYIFMLIFGVIAYDNNWLESITYKLGIRWFIFAQFLILIVLPASLYFGGQNAGIEIFLGGGTWQSFFWAIWEQVNGFAMIIGLLGIAKKYFNAQGSFATQLSNSAYGVYIIHPPIIVGIAAIFLGWDINQLPKFVLLAPVAIFSCFALAWILKQIPGVKNVI